MPVLSFDQIVQKQKQSATETSRPTKKRIVVVRTSGNIEPVPYYVEFAYDPHLVEKMKTLYFGSRKWMSTTKRWWVFSSLYVNQFLEGLDPNEYEVYQRVGDNLKKVDLN